MTVSVSVKARSWNANVKIANDKGVVHADETFIDSTKIYHLGPDEVITVTEVSPEVKDLGPVHQDEPVKKPVAKVEEAASDIV